MPETKKLGVVVVAFDSADVILECLESLFASRGAELAVVVVDNDSRDDTVARVTDWAAGRLTLKQRAASPLTVEAVAKPLDIEVTEPGALPTRDAALTLLRSRINSGFAGGVNQGLRVLERRADVAAFWVLNPDCVVPADTAAKYLAAMAEGPFGLLGCRTIYHDAPDQIQTDGGYVNKLTGVCSSANPGCDPRTTPLPDPATLDYIGGANMVASREFLATAGYMVEDYFLYYEEVDWAARRGHLPLKLVPDAIVYHHGGTSIGSGSHDRRPTPFSNYFNYRNRRMFAQRHLKGRAPIVTAYALAKAAQLRLLGAPDEAAAVVAGILLRRPAPEIVARVRDGEARKLAFGDLA